MARRGARAVDRPDLADRWSVGDDPGCIRTVVSELRAVDSSDFRRAQLRVHPRSLSGAEWQDVGAVVHSDGKGCSVDHERRRESGPWHRIGVLHGAAHRACPPCLPMCSKHASAAPLHAAPQPVGSFLALQQPPSGAVWALAICGRFTARRVGTFDPEPGRRPVGCRFVLRRTSGTGMYSPLNAARDPPAGCPPQFAYPSRCFLHKLWGRRCRPGRGCRRPSPQAATTPSSL